MTTRTLLDAFKRKFPSGDLTGEIYPEILIKTASKDIPPDFPIYWLVQLVDKQLEKNNKIIVVLGQITERTDYYNTFSMSERRMLKRYRKLLVEGALPLAALRCRFFDLARAYEALFAYLVGTHKLSFPSAYGSLPHACVPEDFPIEYLLEAVDLQISELEPAVKPKDLLALLEYREMLINDTLLSYDRGYVEGCEAMKAKRTHAPDDSWYESPKFSLYVQQQAEAAWRVQNSRLNKVSLNKASFIKGYCDGYHEICQEWLERSWSPT